MAGRLEGKVAIVSGAGCIGPGWGNGRAAAVAFAREDARVFAVDLKVDAMTETVERATRAASCSGEIRTHTCDVTVSDQVQAMVQACVTAFGRSTSWSTTSADPPKAAWSNCPRKPGTVKWTST